MYNFIYLCVCTNLPTVSVNINGLNLLEEKIIRLANKVKSNTLLYKRDTLRTEIKKDSK